MLCQLLLGTNQRLGNALDFRPGRRLHRRTGTRYVSSEAIKIAVAARAL